MSPQNCLAKMSPPRLGSSPEEGRRTDERVGFEDEPERSEANARRAADNGRSGNCGESSQAFGDFSTTNEAAAAQDERAGGEGIVARRPRERGVEQNGVREDKSSSCPGARS